MLYSVAFEEKNGKKYYKQHKIKYHLENEDAVLENIPADTFEKKPFYYYENSSWVFDEEAYNEYLKKAEQQQETGTNDTAITQEDMIMAMMELAQQISDLEDGLIEIAAIVGGE